MNDRQYTQLLRFIAAMVAITLWIMSVIFSTKGFSFEMGSGLEWIGVVLALAISAIQIIWNHEARGMRNPTIFLVGVASYVYGIWANIIGIGDLRGSFNVWDNPTVIIFPLILGFFVEVVPEPLMVWSFTGQWYSGDFIGNLFDKSGGKPSAPKPQFHPGQPMKMSDQKGGQGSSKPASFQGPTPIDPKDLPEFLRHKRPDM